MCDAVGRCRPRPRCPSPPTQPSRIPPHTRLLRPHPVSAPPPQLLLDPTTYGANQLYIVGDYFYFFGSCCYLLSALRDTGWFWWAPHAGRCNPCFPTGPAEFGPQPLEVPSGDAEREYWGDIFATWGGGPQPMLAGAGKEVPTFSVPSPGGQSQRQHQRLIVGGVPAGVGHRTPRQSSQRSNVLRSGNSLRGADGLG